MAISGLFTPEAHRILVFVLWVKFANGVRILPCGQNDRGWRGGEEWHIVERPTPELSSYNGRSLAQGIPFLQAFQV